MSCYYGHGDNFLFRCLLVDNNFYVLIRNELLVEKVRKREVKRTILQPLIHR